MAPSCSYEMAASILLCAEDSSSLMGLGAEEEEDVLARRTTRSGELAVEFPELSEECVSRYVETETEHMPMEDYAERLRAGGLDLRVRTDAVDWVRKVHACYSFSPLTACLAINYLDRFLSLCQLPEDKSWMTQLLSVACLSLAAKMEETSVPLPLDLQVAGDARYVFEAKTIQRMELLVLSTLQWRMQAVTPFSYIDYFLRRLNGGDAPSRRSVVRSAELILCIARGTQCLDFRPSEIAAAVAAVVAGEERAVGVDEACTHHVHKERVSQCLEAVQATMTLTSAVPLPLPPKSGEEGLGRSSSSVPQSPTGVLDAGCLSYRSDDTTVFTSHAICCRNESESSPAISSKRRKVSR